MAKEIEMKVFSVEHVLVEGSMHIVATITVHPVGERSRKQKFSDLRTSLGPLWRLHTWFDLFHYRLVA